MYDFEIAFYLYKISRLLEIFEDNKYRAAAYFKAAMSVDYYSKFITKVYEENSLKSIEGIGNSSARIIKELIETGRCPELEKLETKYGIEDYSLILSHGLSQKIIRNLFSQKIRTVPQLETAFHSEEGLLVFGKAEREKVRCFLEEYEKNRGYYLYSYAYCLQNELLNLLNGGEAGQVAMPYFCHLSGRFLSFCEETDFKFWQILRCFFQRSKRIGMYYGLWYSGRY